ncbi:putative methylesterase 11 [Hibiscus syriacus]|uniref:Methylesterase 11 n=1 Tax=Hibiscus syriacus TaxID=106335 RepID=A0A6A3CYS1_HIBSY|nr:putative methylesterase 11 [Hibiscus syriacus]
MGNLCTCFARKTVAKRPVAKRLQHQQNGANSSNRWARVRSSRKDKLDDAVVQEQALAAAILFRQQNGGASLPFDRAASLRYLNSGAGSKKAGQLPRSSSSRARSLTDPLLQPHQLVYQDKLDNLETNHFVLVHGGGFGAWCWYKTIALLEEAGFKATAVDLTGSGIHSFDTNGITSLSQYAKPLTDFLEKLCEGEKVILVGHDFGGACYRMQWSCFLLKLQRLFLWLLQC